MTPKRLLGKMIKNPDPLTGIIKQGMRVAEARRSAAPCSRFFRVIALEPIIARGIRRESFRAICCATGETITTSPTRSCAVAVAKIHGFSPENDKGQTPPQSTPQNHE